MTGDAEVYVNAPANGAEPAVPKPVLPDERWCNTLGMELVPVPGTDVLFCRSPTRVRDYSHFALSGERRWLQRLFPWNAEKDQGSEHPAVNVSWSSSKAFCRWLTQRESLMGLIRPGQVYRLPQDWEWSVAVGLDEPRAGTPKEKDCGVTGVYPWGTEWPPPHHAGNYSSDLISSVYPRTSPVGTYPANRFELYDLGGNVREWCEDHYDGSSGSRVLRGGCWDDLAPRDLLSSRRFRRLPQRYFSFYGFRVVLQVSP